MPAGAKLIVAKRASRFPKYQCGRAPARLAEDGMVTLAPVLAGFGIKVALG
jgi:hypothetical protein